MPINKKVWQKPELTVLLRSNPEEIVLLGCKGSLVSNGPALQNANCVDKAKGKQGACFNCNQVIRS